MEDLIGFWADMFLGLILIFLAIIIIKLFREYLK